jgi:hypothetical protein
MDIKTVEYLRNYYLQKALNQKSNVDHYLQKSPEQLLHRSWCEEIAKLPLAEQCIKLDITHEKLIDFPFGKKPEIDALNHFCAQGFVGAYCEGKPILLLIRAAALNILAQLHFNGRSSACTFYTEAQLQHYSESSELILDAVRNANAAQIESHFNEMYKLPGMSGDYPGLSTKIMSALFTAIGAERLAQITKAVMENPYLYRAGWPDLTMARGSEMLWVEIKTTDRLHLSQIMTIFRMKSLLPGKVHVLQLTKARQKNHKAKEK